MNTSKFGSGTYTLDSNKLADAEQAIVAERREVLARLTHLDAALSAIQALRGVTSTLQAAPSPMSVAPTIAPPSSKGERIKAVLSERPGLTPKDLAAALEAEGVALPHGEVYTYLNRLKAKGQVYAAGKTGSRKYFVTG